VTILVTGATRNVGRLVVDQLLAMGATEVRALTNGPQKRRCPQKSRSWKDIWAARAEYTRAHRGVP
jgi:uncharacterized protein YbjT (DUF2867 family)